MHTRPTGTIGDNKMHQAHLKIVSAYLERVSSARNFSETLREKRHYPLCEVEKRSL